MSDRVWSAYQRAIFADVENGTGHTVILARAGSGKTSSIVEALKHVPKNVPPSSILFVAFNKSIATELASRAPAGVEVRTLHALGLLTISSVWGKVKVDDRKIDDLAKARVGEERTWELRMALKKCVSLAKGTLSSTPEQIDALIDAYGLDMNGTPREVFVEHVVWLLAESRKDRTRIDFDDMVWLPVVENLRCREFRRVFCDETQDLNAAQIELALRSVTPTGRICAVGDDRQAIYGFRGADAQAVNRVVQSLSAKILPLSISYRCPRAVVALAKQIVPDLEAAPDAAEGHVEHGVSVERLKSEAAPGDFILSRTNAPMIGLCLFFLRAGRPATIAGRDVAEGLAKLVKKSKTSTIPEFEVWLSQWHEAERARLIAKKRSTEIVDDKVECLDALSEGLTRVDDLVARIETLFADGDNASRIVLSTTHKAKGLERDRVWMLRDTYRPGTGIEEDNLFYVAVTRAKSELRLVVGIGGRKPRREVS